MFKDKWNGKIMKEFWEYLMEDDSETKKAEEAKRFVMKWRLMFENYKDSLFNIIKQLYDHN